MSERIYPAAAIDDRAEARIRGGHGWVYDSDIKSLTAKPENGGLCDVDAHKFSRADFPEQSRNKRHQVRARCGLF